MKGWLEKLLLPPATKAGQKPPSAGSSLPTVQRNSNLPSQQSRPGTPPNASLPNATVIYGIGASFMFVASVSLLLGGRWFPAIGVFVLGLCLLGFALHLLKHHD